MQILKTKTHKNVSYCEARAVTTEHYLSKGLKGLRIVVIQWVDGPQAGGAMVKLIKGEYQGVQEFSKVDLTDEQVRGVGINAEVERLCALADTLAA